MVEKHGTWPANARVDVDYSKGKPKINFEYPDNGDSAKKQAEKQNNFGPINLIIFIIVLFTSLHIVIINTTGYVGYPEDCNVTLKEYHSEYNFTSVINGNESNGGWTTDWVYGANFTCGDELYMVKFLRHHMPIIGVHPGFYFDSGRPQWKILLEQSIIIFIPIITITIWIPINKRISKYLVKKEWYRKWLPKHQANGWIGKKTKKFIKFKPSDVENRMVEIPYFSNVELDYKTHGDFSEQLERIKIREHRHHKWKDGKVGKEKVELYKWYARFYFKKKPRNGHMDVIFQ